MVGSMLALSLVLAVRLVWVAVPLCAATPLGLASAFVWWVIAAIVTLASHVEFE